MVFGTSLIGAIGAWWQGTQGLVAGDPPLVALLPSIFKVAAGGCMGRGRGKVEGGDVTCLGGYS